MAENNGAAEMKFYRSFFDTAQIIPENDRLSFYDTVMKAYFDGEEVDMEGLPLAVQAALPTIFYTLNKSLVAKKCGSFGGKKNNSRGVKNDFNPPLEDDSRGVKNDFNPPSEESASKEQEQVQVNVQEQEQENEREGEKSGDFPAAPAISPAAAQTQSTKSQRFIPPTLDEVRAHVRVKGYAFSPEAFIAHYTSNGWLVGKNKMKDWRAACVTWQRRQSEYSGGSQAAAAYQRSADYDADF